MRNTRSAYSARVHRKPTHRSFTWTVDLSTRYWNCLGGGVSAATGRYSADRSRAAAWARDRFHERELAPASEERRHAPVERRLVALERARRVSVHGGGGRSLRREEVERAVSGKLRKR